jgi:hypothetical protein
MDKVSHNIQSLLTVTIEILDHLHQFPVICDPIRIESWDPGADPNDFYMLDLAEGFDNRSKPGSGKSKRVATSQQNIGNFVMFSDIMHGRINIA